MTAAIGGNFSKLKKQQEVLHDLLPSMLKPMKTLNLPKKL